MNKSYVIPEAAVALIQRAQNAQAVLVPGLLSAVLSMIVEMPTEETAGEAADNRSAQSN